MKRITFKKPKSSLPFSSLLHKASHSNRIFSSSKNRSPLQISQFHSLFGKNNILFLNTLRPLSIKYNNRTAFALFSTSDPFKNQTENKSEQKKDEKSKEEKAKAQFNAFWKQTKPLFDENPTPGKKKPDSLWELTFGVPAPTVVIMRFIQVFLFLINQNQISC
jgi:hypothetical protein